MLQQTQVATVCPCPPFHCSVLRAWLTFQVIAYWQRWIAKWPTIADLAKADVEVGPRYGVPMPQPTLVPMPHPYASSLCLIPMPHPIPHPFTSPHASFLCLIPMPHPIPNPYASLLDLAPCLIPLPHSPSMLVAPSLTRA
jgi:hypothetical protein